MRAMKRLGMKFLGLFLVAGILGSPTAACVTAQQTEVTALTALSDVVPLVEAARQAAYAEALAKADIKDLPALAQAETVRASAMKQLIRLLNLVRQAIASGTLTKEQKAILMRGLTDTLGDLLTSFGSGPLPAVKLPKEALTVIKMVQTVLDALLPAAPSAAPPNPSGPAIAPSGSAGATTAAGGAGPAPAAVVPTTLTPAAPVKPAAGVGPAPAAAGGGK